VKAFISALDILKGIAGIAESIIGQGFQSHLLNVQTGSETLTASYEKIYWRPPTGAKRQGREADHSSII
jgi:hypothetical protein